MDYLIGLISSCVSIIGIGKLKAIDYSYLKIEIQIVSFHWMLKNIRLL